MNLIKKSLFLLLLPLFSFTAAHKFYVTVTNIAYSEKDQAIQITSRIFIDDLEKVFKERYAISSKMATDNEMTDVDTYLEKYLKSKFIIEINGKQQDYKFIGKKYDNDVVVCFLEITKIKLTDIKSISATNELLTDLFDEQQNVVHFKLKGIKKSFVLTQANNKGMLNLE